MSDEDSGLADLLRRLRPVECMWIAGIQIRCCDSALEIGPRLGGLQRIPRSSGVCEVRDAISALWEVWTHTQI